MWWYLALQLYFFEVLHQACKVHRNADFFSRDSRDLLAGGNPTVPVVRGRACAGVYKPSLRPRQEKGWTSTGIGKLHPSGTDNHASGERSSIKRAPTAQAGEERSHFQEEHCPETDGEASLTEEVYL